MSYKRAKRVSEFAITHTKYDKSDIMFLFLFLGQTFKILKERCLGNAIAREAAEDAFI